MDIDDIKNLSNKIDFANIQPVVPSFKIDTSYIDEISQAVDESNRLRAEREQRELDALEATAYNTAETKERLNKVIDNQNDYIEALKQQIEIQKQQLFLSNSQLEVLKSIFNSGTNGLEVEKELMEIIKTEIDDKHPLWDYVKDKGGDIAVAGITAGVPVLYQAVKAFLASKGILLP